jgi:hypothetical protein
MKKFIILSFMVFSLNSFGSTDLKSCINSIQVIQSEKVSTMEKTTIKAVKDCFKELKTAEKSRQKELKLAARKEKQRKSLEAKIIKLQEKLKNS